MKISTVFRVYLLFLVMLMTGWVLWRFQRENLSYVGGELLLLSGVLIIYLSSHLLRMARLGLLALDERSMLFPLIAAHSMTAFASSFVPFKLGEVLRLSSFFYVMGFRRKAFAIWLSERFGDVLVIIVLVIGLYVSGVSVPASMRIILVIFVLCSIFGLVGLFATTKIFLYLNRHLVLASHSNRGLGLLKASNTLQLIEKDVYKTLEGRFTGFMLLSTLIWLFEIAALSLFMRTFSIDNKGFADMFTSGLVASLPGGAIVGESSYGFYQTFSLLILTLVFMILVKYRMRTASPKAKT